MYQIRVGVGVGSFEVGGEKTSNVDAGEMGGTLCDAVGRRYWNDVYA